MNHVEEILSFWFGAPATSPAELGVKIRRWFMGGPAVDEEIRTRFGPLVERVLDGREGEWQSEPRARLALILVLDQFTRGLFRDTSRAFAGDARAQELTLDALARGWDRELGIEERHFLLMPLMHAESLPLQERGVVEMQRFVADAPEALRPIYSMGLEQSRKYREIIARFGRFPHRNAALGRASTEEEIEFLRDWKDRAPPAGAQDLGRQQG